MQERIQLHDRFLQTGLAGWFRLAGPALEISWNGYKARLSSWAALLH